MPPRRSAPTLESVAAVAGVSRATAGRVLSGSTTVGEGARTAVLRPRTSSATSPTGRHGR